MHVDEAGRDDQALGVDLALGRPRRHPADGDDAVAADRHVAVEPRIAAAVDDLAVADDEVVGRLGGAGTCRRNATSKAATQRFR